MKTREIGIFEYIDVLADEKQDKLPETLQLDAATNEAVLVRLLLGQLNLKKQTKKIIKKNNNYILLPYKKAGNFTYSSISEVFCAEGNRVNILSDTNDINNYLKRNRRNNEIYQCVLFEISNYFAAQKKSPIAAFAHLYRCLEYISYSFPMVYAAKSKSYKGTFLDLKNFMGGQSAGELKFLRKFLETLFSNETTILEFKFEIDLLISGSIDNLKYEIGLVYQNFDYEIDGSTLTIKFKDMLTFFIDTRNRYFHMLVGQGQANFSSVEYDINEYFKSINPFILNWLAIIIQKITAFGFYSDLPGS